jgi:hypothetical protein
MPRYALAVSLSLILAAASNTGAQEHARFDEPSAAHPPPKMSTGEALPHVLTGKERLGGKWMDEQRIDNCKVPPEKRGSKPRPDMCSN